MKQFRINETLVRHLVSTQFPQWKNLAVRQVPFGGWDNRTFRLGEDMLVRLPSAEAYEAQVEKEQQWLPRLAPFLPLSIPEPLASGARTEIYPWQWSIYRWLEGEPASTAYIADMCDFANCLAQFLTALQKIDISGGPLPGPHNFYRGGLLEIYDAETRQALEILKDTIDSNVASEIWETALQTTWQGSPVWVHGDVSAGNLLVHKGKLSAVIDFGMLGVGDPACDLAIAWTLFKDESREIFRDKLSLDPDTWARGRAWTLWKAMIIAAGLTDTNASEGSQCWRIIDEVITEHKLVNKDSS